MNAYHRKTWIPVAVLAAAALLITGAAGMQQKETGVEALGLSGFKFKHALNLPGTPEVIYDAITGDISEWWDHSFKENPKKLYIEARPGGGFYEIFDDSGDGARHATVIYAERGKGLRFEGPLGLSGMAIQMVVSYEFAEAEAGRTLLTVTVHASGEEKQDIGNVVSRVWHHFLFEQFKPYVESGKHLK